MTFGETILKLRLEKQLKEDIGLYEITEELGIQVQLLIYLEDGIIIPISNDLIAKIANYYKIPMENLKKP